MKRNSLILPVLAGFLAAPLANADWVKVFDADDWAVTTEESDLQALGWIFQDFDFFGFPQCVDGTRDCTGVREVVPAPYGGTGNAVLIRGSDPEVIDPANPASASAFPLPQPIPLGSTATFYFKFATEGELISTHFGLTANTAPSNDPDTSGPRHAFSNLATHGQVSPGTRATLGVFDGFWADATLDPAQILEPGIWYELWYHLTHAPAAQGGGYFELYIRGGAFGDGEPYHLANPYAGAGITEWNFREVADAPLARFLNIHNSGNPSTEIPRSDAVFFDDMYMLLDEFSLEVPTGSGETHESLWASYEDFDGWKQAGIGWVFDEFYPWIFHGTAEWLYVSPEGATLDSMYLYDDSNSSWLWTSDSFGGWYYDFSTNDWAWF